MAKDNSSDEPEEEKDISSDEPEEEKDNSSGESQEENEKENSSDEKQENSSDEGEEENENSSDKGAEEEGKDNSSEESSDESKKEISSDESQKDDNSSDEGEEEKENSSDEHEEGNNREHEKPKASITKKRKAVIKKGRKKRKITKEDDSKETLQLLLDHNNGDSEKPPPDRIVSCIPSQFSRCIYKQLTKSDVNGNQSRLLLGKKEVKDKFFSRLEESEIPGVEGSNVLVYGPNGEVYEMKFKIWNRGTPVLTNGWSKFVEDYELQKYSDILTIWMFRGSEDRKICFVIDSTRFDGITKQLSKRIFKYVFQD